MFSAHDGPAQLAFVVRYAAAWRSAVKSTAIAANVSRTATAATTDDVTAASDDVITSADDVTASVDDVIVRSAAAAAAARYDGSGK